MHTQPTNLLVSEAAPPAERTQDAHSRRDEVYTSLPSLLGQLREIRESVDTSDDPPQPVENAGVTAKRRSAAHRGPLTHREVENFRRTFAVRFVKKPLYASRDRRKYVLAWARLDFKKPVGCGMTIQGIRIVLEPQSKRLRAYPPKVYLSRPVAKEATLGKFGRELREVMPYLPMGGKLGRVGEWIVYEYLRWRGVKQVDKKQAIEKMLAWIEKEKVRANAT